MNQKTATIALAVAAVVVVLVFLFLPSPPPPAPPVAPEAKPAKTSSELPASSSADFPSQITPSASGTLPPASASAPASAAAWEDRLDELLTKDTDNTTTVRGLVSSMRGLPPDAQEEFVAHAVNLCEDEQFGLLANIYLDAATPKEVSETIFNDALNRPDEIKLPLLANTLRNPAHPMAGEAREILEMYLDLEPGAVPPGGWDQAVKKYISEQNTDQP